MPTVIKKTQEEKQYPLPTDLGTGEIITPYDNIVQWMAENREFVVAYGPPAVESRGYAQFKALIPGSLLPLDMFIDFTDRTITANVTIEKFKSNVQEPFDTSFGKKFFKNYLPNPESNNPKPIDWVLKAATGV